MRLLLDEMYPGRLAEQLRDGGHDVVAVVELPELVGQPDAEVAGRARAEDRVVVTENVVDYAPLDATAHAGLLLVNARRWPRTRAGLPRLRAALATWLETQNDQGAVDWL
ncbi:hypothetical protein FHU33_1541 [Blastococcus colisei]|uniref:DUF5615 domain-containing protein n=1 Tax=Blastococcus colisei TaxID=1564162 RepID=A0A543PDM3_9ACTN|nr:DUF5615 family PIN-like protein [Blastococcus colisei]TQN42147.1 hypothetical protein FHU33_1541 [Blastococcus colisei]